MLQVKLPRFDVARLVAGLTAAAPVCTVHAQAYKPPPVLNRFPVPVTTLVGKELMQSAELAIPTAIDWVSGKLVVIDRKSDNMIAVFDAVRGGVVRTFGRRGSGPGEFTGPWKTLVPDPRGGAFWIFDTQLLRMTRVVLSQDFATNAFKPSLLFQLQGGATNLERPQWVADGRLVSTGDIPGGLLIVFNKNGKNEGVLGTFDYGDPKLSIEGRQNGYAFQMAVDHGGNRLLLFSHYSDRIDFFNLQGQRTGGVDRPFAFDPVLKEVGKAGRVATVTNQSYNGVRSVKTTASHIYALFSGHRNDDSTVASPAAGSHVEVYSPTGKLERVLGLGAEAFDLTVDPDDRMLFIVRIDPSPGIVEYLLPTPLGAHK
ncbi:MAG TPA: BF3164 family lipoprotein [Gemmatimonadales bacterium]|jgi:DNA-binding beta-propeller fold protein YncE